MEDPQAIIEAIRSAFRDVPRGRITIHEAEVLDLYGTDAERREARRLDTEESWERVPDGHIEECTAALSHLDPEGWRHYLPAYMAWSLRHLRVTSSIVVDQTIYSLDPILSDATLRDHNMARFRLLDREQARAVCRFLRYMAANDGHADGRMATVALDDFWSQFEGSGA